jgi:Leishmanolysin
MSTKTKTKAAVRTYRAHASVKSSATAAAIQSAFKIDVRFVGGLNATQMAAFEAAAERWSKVITGDLPSVLVDGEVIDDILILAEGKFIDGPGGILGQAGPTQLRPGSLLPAKGVMMFDSADLDQMQARGTLGDVITHEMGHVLGIGTIWQDKGLLLGASTLRSRFKGPAARKEYGLLRGTSPRMVPVENMGGPGTADGHWRETVFKKELMTGFVNTPGNPLSRLTVACLHDMGYTVDMSAAEPYVLSNLLDLAESGAPSSMAGHEFGHGHCLPIIPSVLPEESLKIR